MATVAQIRAGIATRLRTITGLQCEAEGRWPEPVLTPSAIAVPDTDNDYTLATTHSTMMKIVVLVDASSLRVAQGLLDPYMSDHGDSSIQLALEGDLTLGGICDTFISGGWQGYGLIPVDGVQYLGSHFLLEVIHG